MIHQQIQLVRKAQTTKMKPTKIQHKTKAKNRKKSREERLERQQNTPTPWSLNQQAPLEIKSEKLDVSDASAQEEITRPKKKRKTKKTQPEDPGQETVPPQEIETQGPCLARQILLPPTLDTIFTLNKDIIFKENFFQPPTNLQLRVPNITRPGASTEQKRDDWFITAIVKRKMGKRNYKQATQEQEDMDTT